MEEQYNKLTGEYATSAREYFMVLRLAIYHITGENLESSYKIAQYEKTEEIYKLAIKILKAINNDK